MKHQIYFIAHRGDARHCRENTLPAFIAAESDHPSFWGVELDIQQTADGQIVVCHDPDLIRVFGIPGTIRKLSFAELQFRLTTFKLKKEGIPRLREVIDVISPKNGINIEIKPYINDEIRFFKELTRILRFADQPILISSFHKDLLFKAMNSCSTDNEYAFLADSMEALQSLSGDEIARLNYIHPSMDLFFQAPRRLQNISLPLHIFTVNDKTQLSRIKQAPHADWVQGVFTDNLGLMGH